MDSFPHYHLKEWFQEKKRDLPWRSNNNPYAVWVSEIMLQQTQVSVVIPYFKRWMQRFPTVKALANAPLDLVIKSWEGLGYYSRARNLHEAAAYVVAQHEGQLPSSAEELKKIKGLGPYTVGAILSFAFHQKAPAVDGNVIRVLARYFSIPEDISKPKTIKNIWALAAALLPEEEPWVVTEALIELGATVCTRKPNCSICPLQKRCQSYRNGLQDVIPFKAAKNKITKLYRSVAIIESAGSLLIRKNEKGKIMSGLQEFPYFESPSEGMQLEALIEKIHAELGLQVSFKSRLDTVSHSFTRYRATLFPIVFETSAMKSTKNHQWLNHEELSRLSFSSGHRKIYELVK